MKANTPVYLALGLLTLGALSGCYTQLATRGYGAADTEAVQGTPAPDGSALGDSTMDSALAYPAEADTLAPRTGAPTVIVNNYYDPQGSYRGYSHWEWDFPALSFGYYSSRYNHYSRPYWWDDPWYSRRHHHHSRHYPPYRPARPISDGTLSGPYKSQKRLFNPEPDYPALQKGRRGSVAAPAPATQVESSRQAAPKQADGGSTQAAQPAKTESKRDGDYPALKKGRR